MTSNEENNDKKIWGLSVNVNAIETAVDLPVCTSIHDIQEVTARDVHLQERKVYVTKGLATQKRRCATRQKYWPIRHELAMMDSRAIKHKQVIMSSKLKIKILTQLHSNRM